MAHTPLRLLGTSAAVKEKRLAALLQSRRVPQAELLEAVREAQVLGSLELSGIACTPEDVSRARRGGDSPEPVRRLYAALRTADPQAPFTVELARAWHRELLGGGAFRTAERTRPGGPPPAPAAFVESRMAALQEWLGVETGRTLRPAEQAALVLARLLEILPFDDGNARIARLAASHLMTRAGARPPVLTGADAARLEQATGLAFQLQTTALVALLEEAEGRALDVQIRLLEG